MPQERIATGRNGYARAIEAGVLVAVFVTPLLFLMHWYSFDELALKTNFLALISLVLLALWILECAWERRIVWLRTPLDLPIALYLLWNLLSVRWTSYEYAALSQTGKYLSYALFYFLIVSHVREPRQVQRLVGAVFGAAFLTGVYGVLQYVGLDWMNWQSGDVRVISSFGNATFFAGHLVLLLPLGINFCLGAQRHEARMGWASLVGLLYFCLLATYTRAAWLGLAGGLVVDAVLLYGRRRPGRGSATALAALAGVVLIVTTIVAASGPYSLSRRLVSSFQMDESNVQRKMAWDGAWGVFRDHPLLGTGAGTLMHHIPEHLDPEFYNTGVSLWVAHAHNEFLEQAADTGIIGLGLFVWMLAAFVFLAWRVGRRASSRTARYVAAGSLAGLLAFMAQNMAGVSLRYPTGGLYLFVIFGLTVAAAQTHSGAPPSEPTCPPPRRLPLALHLLLALALGAGVGWGGWVDARHLLSDIYVRDAMFARDAERYPDALRSLQAALRLKPHSLGAYSLLGDTYLKLKDYEAALRAYQALQTLDAGYAESDRGLGDALLGLKRYDEAIVVFERDAKREHSPVSYTALAHAYAEAGHLEKALAAANEAVKIVREGRPWLHLSPAETYLRRAQILGLMNRRREALADVDQAQKLEPRAARPHLVRGDLFREWGDYGPAISEYRMAISIQPDDPQPEILTGMCYAAQGKWAQAVEHYRAALALKPEDAFTRVKLGTALGKLGRRDEARRELEAVLTAGGPLAEKARAALAELRNTAP